MHLFKQKLQTTTLQRIASVAISLVMVTGIFALSVSAEESSGTEVNVWAPRKDIGELDKNTTNPQIDNTNFEWGVKRWDGKEFICNTFYQDSYGDVNISDDGTCKPTTHYNYNGITVAPDSELYNITPYSKNGLYFYRSTYTSNTDKGIRDIKYYLRESTDMEFSFIAPENGTYDMNAVLQIEARPKDTPYTNVKAYTTKTDKYGHIIRLTETTTMQSADITDLGDTIAELKAGEKITIRALSSGGAFTIVMKNPYVVKLDDAKNNETHTVVTKYKYSDYHISSIYGNLQKDQYYTDYSYQDTWASDAIRVAHDDTQDSLLSATIDAVEPLYRAWEKNVYCYNNAFASARAGTVGSMVKMSDDNILGAMDYRSNTTDNTSKHYGLRFTYKSNNPNGGDVIFTGATKTDTKIPTFYRYGILSPGSDTIDYSTDWTELNQNAFQSEKIWLSQGDQLIYEIAANNKYAGQQSIVDLSSLSVDYETETGATDLNGDRKLDTQDLVCMRQAMLEMFEVTMDSEPAYDVNADGSIDIRDLVAIKKLMV